jgi:hypothetical protein
MSCRRRACPSGWSTFSTVSLKFDSGLAAPARCRCCQWQPVASQQDSNRTGTQIRCAALCSISALLDLSTSAQLT